MGSAKKRKKGSVADRRNACEMFFSRMLLLSAAIFLLLFPDMGVAAGSRVFYLGSRNALDDRERLLLEGFREGLSLGKPEAILVTDFLHADSSVSNRSFPLSAALLRERWGAKRPDLVVASGLPAASFLRRYRKALRMDMPVFVLGVGELELSADQELREAFPVVPMDLGVEQTLALARTLLPELEVLVFVGGEGPEADVLWRRLQELLRPFPHFSLVPLLGLASADLVDVLSRLPERGTAVFCSGFFEEGSPEGDRRRTAFLDLVARHSRAPIFSPFYEMIVGYGAVGGFAVDHHFHGYQGGRIAGRILQGMSPDMACQVSRNPEAPVLVNFQALERFHIDPARIPEGTQILFRPESLVEQALPYLPIVLILAGVFGLVAAALYPNYRRRLIVEERLRFALEATDEGVWDCNLREPSLFLSETLKKLIGVREEELLSSLAQMSVSRPIGVSGGAEVLLQAIDLCVREGSCDCEVAMWGNEDAPGRWVHVRGKVVGKNGDVPLRLTGTVSDITRFKETERQLKNLNRRLDVLASTDALTGCLRKERCRKEIARRVEQFASGEVLCLAVLDMDNMKSLNDSYGHLYGDEALLRLGGILRFAAGSDGLPGRWGGDEFLLLLPYTLERSRAVLESVVRAIASDPFLSEYGVTMSIGLVRYRYRESVDALLERADEAMYAAKEAGRNRIVVEEERINKKVEKVQKRWSARGN